MTKPPTRWRSVLPHLGYQLPPDITPPAANGPVTAHLPLELVRQSISGREWWDIPDEVADHYRKFRPTPLWRARRLEQAVGAKAPLYVKYEGGNLSGSHKFNTALAQAYYYKRAGVEELVTGTGAGQWGTAMAAACAAFGLKCTVFMVGRSLHDKPYRGTLMRLLGAELHASPSQATELGRRGDTGSTNALALAIGEAVEYAKEGERDGVKRAFCIGSGETYSILHQSVIGLEAIDQLQEERAEVDTVVGCVGAGSNFGGIALPFFSRHTDEGTEVPTLLAAESSATPKLSRGVFAYDVTDATGTGPMEAMYTIGSSYAIPPAHSAGLRFHGAAKVISAMRHRDQVAAVAVGQRAALEANRQFALTEMILPAPESGHALAAALDVVTGRDEQRAPGRGVLVVVSGHGLLDLAAYGQLLDGTIEDGGHDEEQLRRATDGLRRVPDELLQERAR
ncbi:TrpB-like pyridoxal phosphate-dependent enzyme [Streptomyces sp. NPDC004327]|uniref:TrpB-like pyridoxal phosphate-dependent enzyme n=1 Tax=Streptomyces sp. NPDC004327 TaxID=3364699 RepID=UPI0036987FFA